MRKGGFMGKFSTRQSIKKKLDRIFSRYIRLRDSNDGYVACVTCGKIKPINEMTVGHFIKRQFTGTRYDERNVFPQCRYCNNFLQGNDHKFAEFLKERFGPNIIDILELAKNQHLSTGDLQLLLDYYTEKLKEIKKIKEFK